MTPAHIAPHVVLLASLSVLTALVWQEGHRGHARPGHGQQRPHSRHVGTAQEDHDAIKEHDMTERIPLDHLTSDQLDQLYDRLEQAELDAEQQARHFQTICGERESYRQAWKAEQKQRATAEARVTELTAGQCTHTLAVCQPHHQLPVDGCPYPRCIAARTQEADL